MSIPDLLARWYRTHTQYNQQQIRENKPPIAQVSMQ